MGPLDIFERAIQRGVSPDTLDLTHEGAQMTHRPNPSLSSSHEFSGPRRSRRVIAGEGMLTPVRDFTWRGDRWVASRDQVAPDHEVVQEHPERFTACYAKESDPGVLAFLERKRALREREPWRLGPHHRQ